MDANARRTPGYDLPACWSFLGAHGLLWGVKLQPAFLLGRRRQGPLERLKLETIYICCIGIVCLDFAQAPKRQAQICTFCQMHIISSYKSWTERSCYAAAINGAKSIMSVAIGGANKMMPQLIGLYQNNSERWFGCSACWLSCRFPNEETPQRKLLPSSCTPKNITSGSHYIAWRSCLREYL